MLYCQNCGQANQQPSNFCRSCGTKLAVAPVVRPAAQHAYPPAPNGTIGFVPNRRGNQFEFEPPRPYSWKTDEFQLPTPTVNQPRPTKTKEINQVQPLAGFAPADAYQTQQMQAFQTATPAHGYHCPRCGSQAYPRVQKQISTGGWIVFAVLLITFFPLFWIGFLIKEETRVCPVCNMKIS